MVKVANIIGFFVEGMCDTVETLAARSGDELQHRTQPSKRSSAVS